MWNANEDILKWFAVLIVVYISILLYYEEAIYLNTDHGIYV